MWQSGRETEMRGRRQTPLRVLVGGLTWAQRVTRFLVAAAIITLLALLLASSYKLKDVDIKNGLTVNVEVDASNLTCCDNQTVTVSNFPATQDVNVTGFPEDAFCCDNQTVTVSNFPATQDVNVTGFPDGTKVILQGTDSRGNPVDLEVSSTGSLQVSIHEPRTAYGSIMTESLTPIFQIIPVYGLNPVLATPTTFLTGQVTVPQNTFVLETGPSNGSFAVVQSRVRVDYRAGQGSRFMFSARFDNVSAPFSLQLFGAGTPEDGIFFGYQLGFFGIFHLQCGKREVRSLQITTGSSTAESVTVTLNGVAFMVPVTASGNIQRTVYEIASFTYAGWKAEPVATTVRFISDRTLPTIGTYSLTGTTVVGTFSLVRSGSPGTQTFIPQLAWNGDKLDGTGLSGAVLHPEFFNSYMISYQYLGAGPLRFYVEMQDQQTPRDSEFVQVHQILPGNAQTELTFCNPSFPFSALVNNLLPGNVTAEVGSMAGFVEGKQVYSGNRFSISNTIETTNSMNIRVLFTVRNARYLNGRSNQAVITVMGVSGSLKHGQPATLYLYRNTENFQHVLGGNPNFQPYGPFTSLLVDTAATTFTPTSNTQLIWAGEIAEISSVTRRFDGGLDAITLQPGESLSMCADTRSGTALWTAGSVDLREDN